MEQPRLRSHSWKNSQTVVSNPQTPHSRSWRGRTADSEQSGGRLQTMKFAHLPLLFLISVCTAHGEEFERKLKWKRVYRRDAAHGTYVRAVSGIEIYTFRYCFCLISFHPEKPDPGDDRIALGSTFPENWRVTRRGVIEVGGRNYFAMVRCREYEGLIRLDSASDRPPKRIKLNESAYRLLRRIPSPNQLRQVEPNPSSSVVVKNTTKSVVFDNKNPAFMGV